MRFRRQWTRPFGSHPTGVEQARAFFTEEMRRVYARYKHGFSLLSPLSSPIFLDVELSTRVAQRRLLESVVIMDAGRRGPISLLAMRSTGYDIGGVMQAGAMIAGLNGFLASSLVSEARSVVHRSIALGTYETIGERARPLPKTRADRASEVRGINSRGCQLLHRCARRDQAAPGRPVPGRSRATPIRV